MSIKCPKCHFENPSDSRFCNKCGTQILPFEKITVSQTKTLQTLERDLTKGSVFAEKYRIMEEIGRGGMGVVLKAEDTKLKRTVALKFLPLDLSLHPEAKERFIREAQAAAALDHPNICTIYEVDEAEGKAYISMAYVEGQSLRERIQSGPIRSEEALDIAVQVADGLKEAHKKGIVHRDIKSANVMVDKKGQAKIMDFGLAKISGTTLITREGTTMGTLAYMSPEQTRGEAVDHRTDIWSLGVVLYEMLSGQLPFEGDHDASVLYSIVHEEQKPLKDIRPDIPVEMQQVVNRALKKKPESRYQSASEMLEDLEKYQKMLRVEELGIRDFRSLLRRIRQPRVAVPIILMILAVCVLVVWLINRSAHIRWARNEALPEINRFLENGDYSAAFHLATNAEKFIPKDAELTELLPKIVRTVSVQTDPPGADVFIRDYDAVESDWEYLGQSPIENIKISRAFKRWKVTKQGFEILEGMDYVDPAAVSGGVSDLELTLTLNEVGTLPPGMVKVRGGDYDPTIVQLMHLNPVRLDEYLIDKYEVTNRQFKEFVDSGGYRKQEFWKHEFITEGRLLSWQEAMKEFVDTTGRPGPATWSRGDYPEGEENYPVRGICWYEAAAYAEFAEKSLPTVYHWNKAAQDNVPVGDLPFTVSSTQHLVPMSNFDGYFASVGSYQGVGPFGTYDMAGNVKEWCWNECEGKRLSMGGACNEPHYMFYEVVDAQPPFLRLKNFGFRCMKGLSEGIKEAADPIPPNPLPDYSQEKPCSDEIFKVLKSFYAYEKTELDPVIEKRDDTPKHWVMEKVSFNAAYGNDRVIAYLFLPKNASPPYQTIINFPGAPALLLPSIEQYALWQVEEITRMGRAVFFPIYKRTFERGGRVPMLTKPDDWRDHIIWWTKDVGRSIDYMESRPETFDCDKIGYFGISLGGHLGTIIPTIEKRIKALVLVSGGLWFYDLHKVHPEVSQINFAARMTTPVLTLNGKYDFGIPVETIEVLHRLFGTPDKDKDKKVYEMGHTVWADDRYLIETFNWFDRYLGPVK